MTKTLLTGLALMMAASTLTIEAQASPQPDPKSDAGSRTVEVRYDSGAIPFVICLDCPDLAGKGRERYITVEVIDDLSPVGYVDVVWSTPGGHDFFAVCGKTPTPQRIPASAELTIYPWMVPFPPCATGFSTSGTVKITFTRDR